MTQDNFQGVVTSLHSVGLLAALVGIDSLAASYVIEKKFKMDKRLFYFKVALFGAFTYFNFQPLNPLLLLLFTKN